MKDAVIESLREVMRVGREYGATHITLNEGELHISVQLGPSAASPVSTQKRTQKEQEEFDAKASEAAARARVKALLGREPTADEMKDFA